MSDLVSTLQLRARVRRDTGFEGDLFAQDPDLTDDILRAARELNDEFAGLGRPFHAAATTITTVSGTAVYNLPADFSRVLVVSAQGSTGMFSRARQVEPYEIPELLNMGLNGFASEFRGFRILNTFAATPLETIEWLPTPSFARPFRVDYVPSASFPISGGEYNIRAGGNGWEEYIVADVAARLLEREEGDPSSALRRKAEALARIRKLAPTRDASGPIRPTLTNNYYGQPSSPWNRGRPR